MKYVLPLGLALLTGMGVCLQRSSVVSHGLEWKLPGVQSADGTKATLAREEGIRGESAAQSPQVASVSRKAGEPMIPVASPVSPVSTWRNVLASLTGPLSLTELQSTLVEGVLRRREEEIKELHEGFRRAGIIDIRQFEWQVSLLKNDWFRRIDAVLDTNQHDRFVVLVEQGLFNEGLAFTVEPGMTILE